MKRRYVSHQRKGTIPLTKDGWAGGIFREADGTEMVVMWNGDKGAPSICQVERSRGSWRKTGHPVAGTI